jgi:hypothetical protein
MGHLIVELNGVHPDATEADIRQFLMPDRERWLITLMKFDPANQRVVIRFWSNTHAAACIKEFKEKGYDIGWAANGAGMMSRAATSSSRKSQRAARGMKLKWSVFVSGLPKGTDEALVRGIVGGFGPITDIRLIGEGTVAFVDFEYAADGAKCIADLKRVTPYTARWADHPSHENRR